MFSVYVNSLLVVFISALLSWIFIPVLSRWSGKLGLLDKPNHRKIHHKPVPVIGGIVIMLASIISLVIMGEGTAILQRYPVLIYTLLLIFITGVCDDRMQVSPVYRLIIQLSCASAVAYSGIRLTSLYGLLGMTDIPLLWQYVLTILIITGSANAFNLIDGIDGLAGGLAMINLLILSWLSYKLGLHSLMVLLLALAGSTVAFLKKNHHPALIFMGDGGSMSLGFLTPVAGLIILQSDSRMSGLAVNDILLLVFCTLVIPVIDSLRVYTGRIRKGHSPFDPDKTHVHHLFLLMGWNHRKVSLFIYGLELLVLVIGLLMNRMAVIQVSLLVTIILFLCVCQLLVLNRGVHEWQEKIRNMENEQ